MMINCMSEREEDDFLDEIFAVDVECEEALESIDNIFKKYSIEFKSDIAHVYGSPEYDVYTYAYSFIVNDKPKLIMGSYSCY